MPVALGPTDPSRANISRKRLRLGFRGSTDRAEAPPPRLATRADGASNNNKHAPRIRKRDQRRARILRWASSRFVELDPDSDVDVDAASLVGHGQCCRPRCGSGAGPHCSRQQESGGHCDSHSGYGLIDGRCGARCCARPVPGAGHCDRCYVPWDGRPHRPSVRPSLLRLPRITSAKCNGYYVM